MVSHDPTWLLQMSRPKFRDPTNLDPLVQTKRLLLVVFGNLHTNSTRPYSLRSHLQYSTILTTRVLAPVISTTWHYLTILALIALALVISTTWEYSAVLYPNSTHPNNLPLDSTCYDNNGSHLTHWEIVIGDNYRPLTKENWRGMSDDLIFPRSINEARQLSMTKVFCKKKNESCRVQSH